MFGRIGIDLGGTKIEGVVLGRDGAVLARRRIPTPAYDAGAVVAAIRDLVLQLEVETLGATPATDRKLPVGIATPGSLSPATGLLRNSNTVVLNGLPLPELIAQTLERPIRIANDANCFCLSEATDGSAAGRKTVFGAILGTGVGGGIVIGGQSLEGRHGIAGEWGHNPLPWPHMALEAGEQPGEACYCGRRGCLETFLSGPGMASDHARRTGETRTAPEIFAAASFGDPRSRHSVDLYIDRLARALAAIINVIDPDAIVLGGGLSNVGLLYAEVPKRWGRWVFSDTVTTELLPPLHGDSSGVRGAAWLWPPN
jgi:fructokinase